MRSRRPTTAVQETDRAERHREDATSLFEGTPSPILIFDVLDGGELALAWANAAAERSGILRDGALQGGRLSSILRPESAQALREGYTESLRIGKTYAYEEFVAIGGVETWWMTTLAPLLDGDGRPWRLVVSFLDLGFLQRTEAALRTSERNFRELIEKTPDAAIVCRADGKAVYVNPSAVKLLRAADAGALVGRCVADFVDPSHREILAERLSRALDEPEEGAAPFELRARTNDGRQLVLELGAMRLVFDGEPGVLLAARDVTALRQAQSKLAVADRLIALGRMAAGVAHEINNPLSYVHANVFYAIEELEKLAPRVGAAERRHVEEIAVALRDALDGSRRVQRIAQDMLSLARAGDAAPRDGGASLVDAAKTALRLVESQIEQNGGIVRYALEPAPRVRAHEETLVHVVLNILLNAAHALRPSERRAEVHLRTWTDATGRAVLEVEDTGAGIAPGDVGRVFDPFFTTRAPGQGMGLGLSICHHIVGSLGGRIEVESELGRGSTFRVVLPPLADDEVAERP